MLNESQSLSPTKSLFGKAILLVAVIIVGLLGVSILVGINYFQSENRATIEEQTNIIVDLQASAINSPLWNFEEEQVEILVKALSSTPDFQAAWIKSTDGEIRFPAGEAMDPETVIQIEKPIIHEEDGEKTDQGTLVLQLSLDGLKAKEASLTLSFLLVGVVLLVVMLVAVGYIIRNITRPLGQMTLVMADLADGNLDANVPAKDRHDEVGQMAQAVEVFKQNGLRIKEMEDSRAQREQAREEEKRQGMIELADRFRQQVGASLTSVTGAVTQLQSTADGMTSIVSHLERQADEVDQASASMSNNVNSVAGATTELTSSIQEISAQAANSTRMTSDALDHVSVTSKQIEGLADAASSIGEIIGIIDEIAEQTNLLALNATIEAARAGEAGKGFAVVASEVKNLASQTASATENITRQVSAIQQETKQSVEAIRKIEGLIQDVTGVTSGIASAVEEQNAATNEIAGNVERVSGEVGHVSDNMGEVKVSLNEVNDRSQAVFGSVTELSDQSRKLQKSVDSFLETLMQ